jgi:integral membrane sensor domain MASE1
MRLLDTSEIERSLSTPERRVQQLDQIWLTAQATGMLAAKPIDLTVHDIWARFHRLYKGHAR